MFSVSNTINNLKSSFLKGMKAGLFCVICLFTQTSLLAQDNPVRVTINVTPPYSTKISDYTSQPNKILAQLQYMLIDAFPLRVYLAGEIKGNSGIRIYTRPGFKPSKPIVLQPASIYNLNLSNIQDIFSTSQLRYEGITEQEIIQGNGLPEDTYTICLRVYNYDTGHAVSDSEPLGCSNSFSITSVEPPVIMQPVCEQEIMQVSPQSMLFTWTVPAGAPATTQYRLKIVEVNPPGHNIHDAMYSAAHPIFFETTVMGNAFMYGPAQPALVPGKTYAFMITAFDPARKVHFRNRGRSEVCSFVWKKTLEFTDTKPQFEIKPFPKYPSNFSINVGNIQIFNPPPPIQSTTVKGKLNYKYIETGGPNNYALANANIRLAVAYATVLRGKDPKPENIKSLTISPHVSSYPDIGKTIAVTQTDANGNYNFTFLENIELGLIYAGSGEFNDDTHRVLVILIDAPHKNFYFSPQYAIIPEKGKVNSMPTIYSKVRSYQVDVTVKPKSMGEELNQAVGTETLSGVNVYLCRKVDFSYQLYPLEDGMLKGKKHQVDPSVANKFPGFRVVAHGTTNTNGIVQFQRVVWHNNPTYQYYVFTDLLETSDQHFTSGAPTPIAPPTSLPSTTGLGTINPATEEFPTIYYTLPKSLYLQPNFPRIFGKVLDSPAPLPMAGVSLSMRETYEFKSQDQAKILYPAYKASQNSALNNCVNSSNSSINQCIPPDIKVISASDGTFTFNDLTLLFSKSSKKVIGPTRQIKTKHPGYKQDIRSYTSIDYGKQVYNNIILTKGAYLSGFIRDAETGQGLKAKIRLMGDNSFESSNGGYYRIPVLKIPGQPQKLIVERQNYITDTITFVAGQDNQSLDINLYSAKRRLKVKIFLKDHLFNPIYNCWVHVLDVKNNQGYPIGDFSGEDGIVELSFKNAGDNPNQVYRVRVGMLSYTDRNFETRYFNVKIPVSGNPTLIMCGLPRATCLTGIVYAGEGSESPVHHGTVRYQGYLDTLTSITSLGEYRMTNVPVRSFNQYFVASKSQSNFIGDEKRLLLNVASNQCVTQDFHLTVYDDMDITQLMGFPMEVTRLTATDDGKVFINGNITDLPANDQFETHTGKILAFNNIQIKKGSKTNIKGVPIAEPATLPVKLITSTLDNLKVLNTFDGKLSAPGGLLIDRYKTGSPYGVIKGRVMVPPTEFNTALVSLPHLYLATSTGTGTAKMLVPVFVADPQVKKPVTLPASGFFVCNNQGADIRYSFPHFQDAAYADPAKSFLNKDKVSLQTTLHTNCDNTIPKNLKLNMGMVEITKSGPSIPQSNTITLQLDKWKLTSNDWEISTSGIWLKNANIQAKVPAGIKDLEITYSTLKFQNATANFDNINLLGNIPLKVTTPHKGLIYIESGGKMQWQLYAAGEGGSQAAHIEQLPGLGNQKIPISLVTMLSDGSDPKILVKKTNIKLFEIVDFETYDGTVINIYELSSPPWIQVQGKYKPGIQYINEFAGNMVWEKKSQGYEFLVNNPGSLNFIHNNMLFEWIKSSINISNDLFTVKGTTHEQGKLMPVNINLFHQNASTRIEIPANEKIYITQDKSKFFDKVVGGMELNKATNTWNNFWFEGEMMGMKGISDNPQKSRVKFVCNGEIAAVGQSIKVSKLDDFPGMSFTYDFTNSRLIGSIDINKNLMGMQANGIANCVFDPNGWYLNIIGNIDITGIGGCDLFGLFGDYKAVPPALGAPFGALKCIPTEFQNKVSGFLLQGGITKQLIPSIEWGVTIPVIEEFVGVQVNADLSINARTWMSFDPTVNTYGFSLLAEGAISGGASGGVFRLSTYAGAQLGISGVYYSNGNYNITGCGSMKAGVEAEVYTPPPIGWIGVDIPSPEIGLTMKISSSGKGFSLILGSCGDNLCP